MCLFGASVQSDCEDLWLMGFSGLQTSQLSLCYFNKAESVWASGKAAKFKKMAWAWSTSWNKYVCSFDLWLQILIHGPELDKQKKLDGWMDEHFTKSKKSHLCTSTGQEKVSNAVQVNKPNSFFTKSDNHKGNDSEESHLLLDKSFWFNVTHVWFFYRLR